MAGDGLLRRLRWPFVGLALFGAVLLLVVFLPGLNSGAPPATAECAGERVEITVVVSPEKSDLMSALAKDYSAARRPVRDKCAAARVVKSSALGSGGAVEGMACGWNTQQMGDVRPDAWSPAATTWLKVAQQRHLQCPGKPTGVSPTADREAVSLAKSPLVVGMPRPMAEALGWPDKPIGWRTLLELAQDPAGWAKYGHPEWGAFRLGKTNPNLSTSGLHATIAAFFAGTGRSDDLTEADLADPKAVAYVKGVENSVVHYGETTLTFLQNLYEAGRGPGASGLDYISAVTVEEKSIVDFNRGQPEGRTEGKAEPPKVPLVAVYPNDGTLMSDNPYLALDWPDTDPVRKDIAKDFQTFLTGKREQFMAAGFRDAEGKAGPELSKEKGLLTDRELKLIRTPSGPVMAKLPAVWQQHRKRANVLMVIDVSGSMADPAVPGGPTRLDAAKAAAVGPALDNLAPDDRLGLWTFSSAAPGESTPWRVLVESGPVSAVLPGYRKQVEKLEARGDTALYATIRQVQREMRQQLDPARINAVVLLSDGANRYPEDENLESLVADLRQHSPERSVRVFPIAYGESSDLRVLERIARASRAKAYDSQDARSLEKVVAQVLSNF
ncbi:MULTISPECIES: substrate-binding domain-containing protein [unclassified Crossiella]|uniref:substrate-binding domain-containing protein n=1 Tax=unclassified Crossiella TaxID=2620835 RepID=UPI001FFFFC75|nr:MULTISPECIES: substrate-binding domain-containing protein [unclassified Crossiella]MCK2241390.1 substrate-binding and VWA domain-containing protein [Crossiella sp. S99.2]MCK2253466.1 substrate-binding and VWA domain-containing protein [Crossiella sp. S99.1]